MWCDQQGAANTEKQQELLSNICVGTVARHFLKINKIELIVIQFSQNNKHKDA